MSDKYIKEITQNIPNDELNAAYDALMNSNLNKTSDYEEVTMEELNEYIEGLECQAEDLRTKLAKANNRVIDSIIEPLFKARWSGNLSDAPVSEMRDQLFKTLRDQTMGYWSGHTAYNIAVDGGFLINDKKGANKRLTSLGAMFLEQEQLRKEQVHG